MNDIAATTATRRQGPLAQRRRSGGITLIELGFVVGIIAIIVVGVLAIYNAVKRSQEVTEVVGQVAQIRQAVSNWAGGGSLKVETRTVGQDGTVSAQTTRQLQNFSQLSVFLAGTLKSQASNQSGLTIENVNNWPGSSYVLAIDPSNSNLWTITITEIPLGAAEPLGDRLRTSAEQVGQAVGSGSATPLTEDSQQVVAQFRL